MVCIAEGSLVGSVQIENEPDIGLMSDTMDKLNWLHIELSGSIPNSTIYHLIHKFIHLIQIKFLFVQLLLYY